MIVHKKVCAWCRKRISDGDEVFALMTKAAPGSDLRSLEGSLADMYCASIGKNVPGIVVTADSQAKKAGWDIVFMLCSTQCWNDLAQTLKREGVRSARKP